MQRLLIKTLTRSSYTQPSIENETSDQLDTESLRASAEEISQAENADVGRLEAQALARRQLVCHARSIQGALPCLRTGCPGRWDDKGAWVRHLSQLIPDRLWICHFCKEILDRKERLEGHLGTRHKHEQPHDIQQCIAQEPFKVPFHGKCGFCNFESNNWTFFWLTHVYEHLIGKNGPRFTKEQWNLPYPPPFDLGSRSRSRPPPDFLHKFKKQNEDDDDDDLDDDRNGGPTKGSRGFGGYSRSSRSGSLAQQGNTSSTSYTQTYQGSTGSNTTWSRHTSPDYQIASKFAQKSDVGGFTHLRISEENRLEEFKEEHGTRLTSLGSGIDDRFPSYSHVRTLFQGTATVVDEVRHCRTNDACVRKRVRAVDRNASLQRLFAREVQALKKVSHPHVTRLIDHCLEPDSYSLFLTPVGECTLKQYLEAPPHAHQGPLQKWHHCLTDAISYLHNKKVNICHLDIKPSNIIVAGGSVFLGDFGISRTGMLTNSCPVETSTMATSTGLPMTPMYAAPELIEKGLWSAQADVFALGCVFLEMATILARIAIQKFYAFLLLVRQQTLSMTRHDSWDVARTLWSWTLKRRISGLQSNHASTSVLKKSREASVQMLQRCPNNRPSMRTIAKTFTALSCCKQSPPVEQLSASQSTDDTSQGHLLRMSIESPKYRFTIKAAAIQHSLHIPENSNSTVTRHCKPKQLSTREALMKMGSWVKTLEELQNAASSTTSRWTIPEDKREARITQARRPRKCGSWPVTKKERRNLALEESSFCIVSGEMQVKRGAEDAKSDKARLSGWSKVSHTLPSESGLTDIP